ncbi:MAG: DEAD/DEAH box helicase [Spirochaetes bacterium]|nr:DEAD/DEAH box helicase [Spirochaetota bacterium]
MPDASGSTSLLIRSSAEFASLADIAQSATVQVYTRGLAYANSRRIQIQGRTGDTIRAKVTGTEVYATSIDLKQQRGSCTCPADKPCKHIVALAIFVRTLTHAQFSTPETPARTSGMRENKRRQKTPLPPKNLRLAIFWGEKSIELGVLDESDRVRAFDARHLQSLKDKHRSFALFLYSQSRNGIFSPGAAAYQLLKKPDILSEVGIFFKKESFPRAYAGTLPVRYGFVDTIEDEEKEKRFADYGYYNASYRIALICDWLHEKKYEQCGLFFLGEKDGKKIFLALESHAQGIGNGPHNFEEIFALAPLVEALPQELKHLWESRVTHGPYAVFSLAAAEAENGKPFVEAEFTVAYTRDAQDPSTVDFKATELYTLHPDRDSENNLRTRMFDLRSYGDHAQKIKLHAIHKTGALIERLPLAEHKILSTPNPPGAKDFRAGKWRLAKTRYLEYFEKVIPYLRKKGVIVRIHDNVLGLLVAPTVRVQVGDASGIDWFEGSLEIEGLSGAEVGSVMRAYRKKEEIVKLADGRWIRIAGSEIGEILASLENLGLRADAEGKFTRMPRSALLSLEQEKAALLRTEAGAKKALAKFRKFVAVDVTEVNPPESFTATLRPYQKQGLGFLLKLYNAATGGILADDMGLGKTVQSIAAMAVIAAQKKQARFLVVCPLAAMGVWEHELERFAPFLTSYRWHGQGRDIRDAAKAQVVITSFATFALDAEKFAEHEFALAFIDEAQFAKNHKTRAAAALRQIKATAIICLTGTPVENHLEDLWALFDVIFPGYLGTAKSFKGAYGGKGAARSIEILRKKIAPFLLRRTKAEVLTELPEKTETVVRVPMSAEQARIYESARIQALHHLGALSEGTSPLFEMLRHLMNLRRISCHPYLEDKAADPLLSGKLQYLDEKIDDLAETASGVLIFSQFTAVLSVVMQLFQKRGMHPLYLDGKTKETKRRELVHDFQAGKNKFFLISLRAGGTALTLTQADTVIHLDPWWNPAVENQASDRAHRIGQKRRVFVYKLVSEKTVEEKVLLLQEKKRELYNALLGETGGDTSAIGREEIEYLLSQ